MQIKFRSLPSPLARGCVNEGGKRSCEDHVPGGLDLGKNEFVVIEAQNEVVAHLDLSHRPARRNIGRCRRGGVRFHLRRGKDHLRWCCVDLHFVFFFVSGAIFFFLLSKAKNKLFKFKIVSTFVHTQERSNSRRGGESHSADQPTTATTKKFELILPTNEYGRPISLHPSHLVFFFAFFFAFIILSFLNRLTRP
jgi:hypothetical protein